MKQKNIIKESEEYKIAMDKVEEIYAESGEGTDLQKSCSRVLNELEQLKWAAENEEEEEEEELEEIAEKYAPKMLGQYLRGDY